jgi:hypothetical protein
MAGVAFTFVPYQTKEVSFVAAFLGCSPRRVRALLSQGRIQAYKDKGDVWKVLWPLVVTPGTRGPDLRCYQVRRAYKAISRQKKGGKRAA